MFAAGALAFGAAVEIAFFPQPPHRSTGPDRRAEGDAGQRPSLIGSIRQALAELAGDTAEPWLPRLRQYPY
ncbi:MAG TPA: hypothetical protein VFW95_01880 [Candidatus Limnocylindria bacterium]|nr:hypothetical protein [Candidatus Limnocylindria bacterium]